MRKVLTLDGADPVRLVVAQINLLLDYPHRGQAGPTARSPGCRWPIASWSCRWGVFGVALGTVILPALARHHVSTDREGFSRSLDWGLRMTLLIC